MEILDKILESLKEKEIESLKNRKVKIRKMMREEMVNEIIRLQNKLNFVKSNHIRELTMVLDEEFLDVSKTD